MHGNPMRSVLRSQANKCGKPGRADPAKPNQAYAGHSETVNQDGPERRRQGRGQYIWVDSVIDQDPALHRRSKRRLPHDGLRAM